MTNYNERLDEILLKYASSEVSEMGIQEGAIDKNPIPFSLDQAKASILALIEKEKEAAEEHGRNEVFEAIEDGRLVVRRFVTKEQLRNELKGGNK